MFFWRDRSKPEEAKEKTKKREKNKNQTKPKKKKVSLHAYKFEIEIEIEVLSAYYLAGSLHKTGIVAAVIPVCGRNTTTADHPVLELEASQDSMNWI